MNVSLCGVLASDWSYSHTCQGIDYFKAILSVKRKSVKSDLIPIIANYKPALKVGSVIKVTGSFRSYNDKISDTVIKLRLFCFCDSLSEPIQGIYEPHNEINGEAIICRIDAPRVSPLGIKLRDVLLVVPRSCGKSDYIPCVLFGPNTKKEFCVGDVVYVSGRVQSRVYQKDHESCTAYEVAVAEIKKAE